MTLATFGQTNPRARRVRVTVAGLLAALALLAAGGLWRAARAVDPQQVVLVGDPTGISGAIDVTNQTFSQISAALAAVPDGEPITIGVGIPGFDDIDLPDANVVVDPTRNLVAIDSAATVAGVSADVLLTARWADPTVDAIPDLAVGVKVTDIDLSQLNAAWASAIDAIDPHIQTGWIVLSSASFALDPTDLGGAGSFYDGDTIDIEAGANLIADFALDHANTPELRRLVRTLGSASSVLRAGGSLADSAAVLFGGTGPDLAGLHLRGAVPLPASLPPWMTSHEPFVDLELFDVGGGSLEPKVMVEDRIVTDLGGAVNAFTYEAAFDPTAYESGAASSIVLTLDQPELAPPFGLDWLSLSDVSLHLGLTAGDDDPIHVTGALTATVAVTPSHDVAVTMNIDVDGSNVSGSFVFDPDETVPVSELVALVNEAFPGASFDSGALGATVGLRKLALEAATTAAHRYVTVGAEATIENEPSDLLVDVLVHAVEPTGGGAKLLLGLRAKSDDPSCDCIRLEGLVSGPVGAVAAEVELPAVDVMAVLPTSATIGDDDLSDTARAFVDGRPTGTPATQSGGVHLAATLRVTSLGDAAMNALDWGPNQVITLTGDLGASLTATDGHFAVGVDGIDLAATLPAPGPNAGILPDWASFPSGLSLHIAYDGALSTLTVAVETDIAIEVGGLDLLLNGRIVLTASPDGTAATAVLTLENDWVEPFGQAWLGTVTDASLTLSFVFPTVGDVDASAVFAGTVDLPGSLPPVTVELEIGFTGSTPEATLTISIGTVTLDDVFALVGQPSMQLPIDLSIDATTITVRISTEGALFAINATTSLTWDGGGVGASLLVAIDVPATGSPRFTAGLRLQGPGGDPLLLSHLLPVPIDFELPAVAFVFSSGDLNMDQDELSAPEFEFLKPLYGCDLDDEPGPDCTFATDIDGGALTFLGNIPLPDELTEDGGILDQIGIPTQGGVRLQGTLPLLDGAGDIRLQLFLPAIVNDGTLPDLFQRVELSLFLQGSVSPPSLALGFEGELDLRMRQSDTPTSDETNCVTTLKGNDILPGADDGGVIHDYCYAVIPMEAVASISISSEGPRVELSLGLSRDDPNYVWQAPFGIEWLSIHAITVQLGVTITPTGPEFDIGVLGDIQVGEKRVYGAISLGIATLPNPPFVRPAFRGVIVGSATGIEMNDLYLVYRTIAQAADAPGSASLPAHVTGTGMPNFALKNLDFRFSLVSDPTLCLNLGLRVQADLYANYTGGGEEASSGACDPPVNVVPCADRDDGCFAGVLLQVDETGIVAQGSVSGFELGPLVSEDAVIDLSLRPTDTHFRLEGGAAINDLLGNEIIGGSMELSLSLDGIHFDGDFNLFGIADAYVVGDASFDLTNPQFSFEARLRSGFGDALTAGLHERLDPLIADLKTMNDIWLALTATGQTQVNAIERLGVPVPETGDPPVEVATFSMAIQAASNGLTDLALDDSAVSGFFVDDGIVQAAINAVLDAAASLADAGLGTFCAVYPDDDDDGYSDDWGVPCSLSVVLRDTAATLSDSLNAVLSATVPSGTADFEAALDDLVDGLVAAAVPVEFECAQFSSSVNALQGSASVDDLAIQVAVLGTTYGFALDGWTFSADASGDNVGALFDAIVGAIFGGPNADDLCDPLPIDPEDVDDPAMDVSVTPLTVDEGGAALVVATFPTTSRVPVVNAIEIDWGDGSDVETFSAPIPTLVRGHTFVDDNPSGTKYDTYDVTVTNLASDITETREVTVRNVKPANVTVNDVDVDEGEVAIAVVQWDDVGLDDTHAITVNWGDGTTSTDTGVSREFTTEGHVFADDPAGTLNSYFGAILVVDDDKGARVKGFAPTVHNVAPSITDLGLASSSINENQTATLTVQLTDPGLDAQTVVITWGDGGTTTVDLPASAGARSVVRSHVYRDDEKPGDDVYPISVSVTDDDGDSDTADTSIAVANVAPTVRPLGLSKPFYNEHDVVALTIPFTDPATVDFHTITVDWGDGTADTIVTPAAGTRTVVPTHRYLDDNPTTTPFDNYAISVTVADDDGGLGTGGLPVTVKNVAPVVGGLGLSASSIDENGSVTLTVPFSDVGTDDTHVVSVDWGDGSAVEPVPSAAAAGSRSVVRSHVYRDDNPSATSSDTYTISVTVADDDGGTHGGSTSVDVDDVAPTIPTLSATGPIDEYGSTTVTGSFADVGPDDTHTATIDWEDGAGPVPLPLGAGSFTATKQYGDDGTYTITVKVTDDDTLHVSRSTAVVVRSVNPIVAIDDGSGSGAVTAEGVQTFIVRAGSTLGIGASVTDAGSDDETVTFDWNDGSSDTLPTFQVNTGVDDPLKSPTLQPRSFSTSSSHAWTTACLFQLSVRAVDDDAGSGSDTAPVVVTGTDTLTRTAGFWTIEYTAGKKSKSSLSADQQACYLAIVRHLSGRYTPANLATANQAKTILGATGNDARVMLERQLLAAWLNLANGSVLWDQLVDSDGNGTLDMPFNVLATTAESALASTSASKAQVIALKNALEKLNLG